MNSENRQESSNQAKPAPEWAVFARELDRIGCFTLFKSVALAMIAVGFWSLACTTFTKKQEEAVAALADFEEITGEAYSFDLTLEKERIVGWWTEYVVGREEFSKLSSLARDFASAMEGALDDEPSPDKAADAPAVKEAKAAYEAYAAEIGRADLRISELAWTFGSKRTPFGEEKNWIYIRDVAPEEGYSDIDDPIALVGFDPLEPVPPTGRSEHPYQVAEFREFVTWNANPVIPFEFWLEAAMEAYPMDEIGLPLPKQRTNEEWNAFRTDLSTCRDIGEFPAVFRKYDVSTYEGDGKLCYDYRGLLLDMIRRGKIPPPRKLDQDFHDKLRREVYPGSQQFLLSSYFVTDRLGLQPIDRYAAAKGLERDEVLATMQLAARDNPGIYTPLVMLLVDDPTSVKVYSILAVAFVLFAVLQFMFGMPRPGGPVTQSAGAGEVEIVEESSTATEPKRRFTSKKEFGLPVVASSDGDGSGTNLAPTDPREIRSNLTDKGAVGRSLAHRKEIDVSAKTSAQIKARTEEVEAEGEYLATILRKEAELHALQNEIADHKGESAVQDLKQQKREAQLEAEIAGLKRDKEKADRERINSKKKPVPPPVEQPKPKPKPISREERVRRLSEMLTKKEAEIDRSDLPQDVKDKQKKHLRAEFERELNKIYGR